MVPAQSSDFRLIQLLVDEKVTDKNGRITDFLSTNASNPGICWLTYRVELYYKKNKLESFYPFIEVVFQLTGTSYYHVPIILSAYGYSTYRGNYFAEQVTEVDSRGVKEGNHQDRTEVIDNGECRQKNL